MGSGDRRPAKSAPAGRAPTRRALPHPAAAPPAGQRWVLVAVAPPARTRTPESEARAACRERQQLREREERTRAVAVMDDEDHLLAWVCHRSLTMAESDARRLRRKNAAALRIAIEESERFAAETAKKQVKVAKLERRQDRAAERLKGLVIVSSSDDDDGSSSSNCSDDQPPAADGYSYAGDRKGKGPARKY